MPSRATLVKMGIAVGAVIGGSFAGASIAAPVLTIAQESPTDGADGASDAATGTDDSTTPAQATQDADGDKQGRRGPGHMCSGEAPSAEEEASVRAAVEDEEPGATVDRIGTDCENGAAYVAELTRSDGARAKAFLDEDFEVTSVQDCGGPGGRRGPGPGQRGGDADGQADETSDSDA